MFTAIQKINEHTFHVKALYLGDNIMTWCGMIEKKDSYISIGLSKFIPDICSSCISNFKSLALSSFDEPISEVLAGYKIKRSLRFADKLVDYKHDQRQPPTQHLKNSKGYKKIIIKDFCKKARKCKI